MTLNYVLIGQMFVTIYSVYCHLKFVTKQIKIDRKLFGDSIRKNTMFYSRGGFVVMKLMYIRLTSGFRLLLTRFEQVTQHSDSKVLFCLIRRKILQMNIFQYDFRENPRKSNAAY